MTPNWRDSYIPRTFLLCPHVILALIARCRFFSSDLFALNVKSKMLSSFVNELLSGRLFGDLTRHFFNLFNGTNSVLHLSSANSTYKQRVRWPADASEVTINSECVAYRCWVITACCYSFLHVHMTFLPFGNSVRCVLMGARAIARHSSVSNDLTRGTNEIVQL